MKRCLIIAIIVFVALGIAPPLDRKISVPASASHLKIAFGSCFGRLGKENAIFRYISEYSPHVWAWIGDYAYADRRILPTVWVPASIDHVIKEYNHTKYNPDYHHFERHFPIIGTWDDHDYGCNNGDRWFSNRDTMKKVFLDFIAEPKGSARRVSHQGVYEDYSIDIGNFTIRIILLDVRYGKDPSTGDMLGPAQWDWLETVFATTKDDVYLVASGTRIFPTDSLPTFEDWFGESRWQLLRLIKKHAKSGVILLSGDVHFGQIYRLAWDPVGLGYPLLEVCSSGLTHTCSTDIPFCGTLLEKTAKSAHDLTGIFDGFNFGTIEVFPATAKEDVIISLQVRNYTGQVVLEHNVTYRELTFHEGPENQSAGMLYNRTTLHFAHKVLEGIAIKNDSVAVLLVGVAVCLLGVGLAAIIHFLIIVVNKYYNNAA